LEELYIRTRDSR